MKIEHKIFQPDILLQDHINSFWCENVHTLNGKLPICLFLKNRGIPSLEISPSQDKDWYGFGLPVNKNWETETFTQTMLLSFAVYSESPVLIDVSFQNAAQENSKPVSVKSDHADWNTISIESPIRDIRMVLFCGSAKSPNYVIKDIVLKSI